MSEVAALDILLPFHGDFGHFREAVTSVLGQSSAGWSLTILEDGDLHGQQPERWVASLADPRVRYLRNEEHLGIARTFQRLLDTATSPYATFMGCDDIMLPNYVDVVTALAARFPEADLLHPGVRVIDSAGNRCVPLADRIKALLAPRLDGPAVEQGERTTVRLLHGNWAYFPAICWKTSSARAHGFRVDLPTTLDLELLMKILIPTGRIALDPTVAFLYRRHQASASSSTARSGERFAEEDRLFAEIGDRASATGWRRAARAADLHVTSRLNRLLCR